MIAAIASAVGAVALVVSAVWMLTRLDGVPFSRRCLYALLPAAKLCCVGLVFYLCVFNGRAAAYAVVAAAFALASTVQDRFLVEGLAEAERLEAAELVERALAEQVGFQQGHLAEAEQVSAEAAEVSARLLARRQALAVALDAGDGTAASAALSDLVDATFARRTSYCGNKAMDALLCGKAAQCADADVELRASASLPDLDTEADAQLCAVVANLVDNAVAAVRGLGEGDRWVELAVARQGRATTVRVVNPVGEGGTTTMRAGRAAAEPGTLARHGWGQKIVASIVERSGGAFTTDERDNLYTASAILNS